MNGLSNTSGYSWLDDFSGDFNYTLFGSTGFASSQSFVTSDYNETSTMETFTSDVFFASELSRPHNISILAFNSLYDVWNNRISALQQQAARADPKQCKSFSPNGPRPGWDGAGYHRIDEGCDIYPASYIGPGLWLDPEFCSEPPKSKGH